MLTIKKTKFKMGLKECIINEKPLVGARGQALNCVHRYVSLYTRLKPTSILLQRFFPDFFQIFHISGAF